MRSTSCTRARSGSTRRCKGREASGAGVRCGAAGRPAPDSKPVWFCRQRGRTVERGPPRSSGLTLTPHCARDGAVARACSIVLVNSTTARKTSTRANTPMSPGSEAAQHALGEIQQRQHRQPLRGVAPAAQHAENRRQQGQCLQHHPRAARTQRGEPPLPDHAECDERQQRDTRHPTQSSCVHRAPASRSAASARRRPCACASATSSALSAASPSLPDTWLAP